jgi:hypothetical protein
MALHEQLINKYREQGFVVLSAVFSPQEVQELQAECGRLLSCGLADRQNLRTLYRMNSGDTPERIDPVIDVSPCFQATVRDPRITDVLRQLFDDEALIFKDKLIFKAPGTQGYPAHQDYAWWKHLVPNPSKILTVTVAIDEAGPHNGGIQLWQGFHHSLYAEKRNLNEAEIAHLDTSKKSTVLMKPGDVLLMHALAPHSSETNSSPDPRRLLYLTYSAASFGDLRTEYYEYYKQRELADAPPGAYFK